MTVEGRVIPLVIPGRGDIKQRGNILFITWFVLSLYNNGQWFHRREPYAAPKPYVLTSSNNEIGAVDSDDDVDEAGGSLSDSGGGGGGHKQ